MRPVALGRRNWIHIGSSQAGPKIAAILSVMENCRRLKLRVRDYLARCSLGSPISPSGVSQNLLPLPGPPGIANDGNATTSRSQALSHRRSPGRRFMSYVEAKPGLFRQGVD